MPFRRTALRTVAVGMIALLLSLATGCSSTSEAPSGHWTSRSRPSQYGARSSRLSTFIAPDSGSGSVAELDDFGTL